MLFLVWNAVEREGKVEDNRTKHVNNTKNRFCKGDILASDEFKSNTILPEISRAWDAENGNLAHDWLER